MSINIQKEIKYPNLYFQPEPVSELPKDSPAGHTVELHFYDGTTCLFVRTAQETWSAWPNEVHLSIIYVNINLLLVDNKTGKIKQFDSYKEKVLFALDKLPERSVMYAVNDEGKRETYFKGVDGAISLLDPSFI